jgi:uncharacterized protein (TIGR02996 family)
MRTFHYRDAKSDKFWNIELKGNSFTVHFGRQGTKGRTQTREFASPAAAQKEHDKLITEKLAKGYVQTTLAAVPNPAMPPRAAALRSALEDALAANPDDLAAHMAYADHLQEQGDPRGEFIQVQLALEDPANKGKARKKLQEREHRLAQDHQEEWLGDIAPFLLDETPDTPCNFRFTRGWLHQLHIHSLNVNFARALTRAPQTRLLRELYIDHVAGDDEQDEYEPGPDVPDNWERDRVQFFSLHPLVRSPYLGNVRRFRLGNECEGDDYRAWEGSYTLGIAAAPLLAKMPRIEEIHLLTRGVDLAQLFALPNLRHLRVLRVYHMNRRHPLEELAANPALHNLTHLLFHPHHNESFNRYRSGGEDHDSHSYLPLEAVRALLRSSHLPNLTHLQLRLSSMGDQGCREFVASGILRRLKMLDLHHGRVTDEGARALAACPDLRNLERLDLERNGLTAAGARLLRGVLGRAARTDNQQTQDELAGGEYLFEGDFE